NFLSSKPRTWPTCTLMPPILAAVALLASYVPSRHAANLDPMEALATMDGRHPAPCADRKRNTARQGSRNCLFHSPPRHDATALEPPSRPHHLLLIACGRTNRRSKSSLTD